MGHAHNEDTTFDGTGENTPGHRILGGTDLEMAYALSGDDLVLRVNKSGVQIFRVKLDGALKEHGEPGLRAQDR